MTSFLRQPAVLLALTGGFTALGLFLMLTGTGSRPQAGLAVVLLFGVGGLPFAIGMATRRPEPASRRLVTLPDGSSAEGLRLPRTRIPRPFVILASLGMSAGSFVFLLSEPSGRGPLTTLVLGAAALLFAAVAVATIVRRPGPDDGMWFTVRGLLSRASGSVGYVPWVAVDRIALTSLRGQPTMRLHLRDTSAVVSRNTIPFLDATGRTLFGSSTYPVSLTSTAADPMAIVDLTTKLVEQAWNRGADPHILFDHPLAHGVPSTPGAVTAA